MLMENNRLYRIFYISKASKDIKDSEVMNIIEVAQKRNAALNITGMLLLIGDYFCQAIEGPKSTVE